MKRKLNADLAKGLQHIINIRKFAEYRKLLHNAPLIAIFVLAGLLGIRLHFNAHAATFVVATEAEQGTVSGNTSSLNDASASNGNAIKFGTAGNNTKPVFAFYYLWWTNTHWHDKLGPHYPYAQSPNPLPADLDSTGCGTANNYPSNQITDVSQGLAYDQDNPSVIEQDVRLAASVGVQGFAVNWIGDGTSTQTVSSNGFNQRLQYVFDAVDKVNSEGVPFKLILNYQGSANVVAPDYAINDLNYFLTQYGNSTALDHTYSSKPELIYSGTWKYTDSDLDTISQAIRPRMLFLGDEKPSSWDADAAADLDGTTYYWSSQNPYNNPASFTQLQQFADTVRSSKNPDGSDKLWLAPFTPGYNAMLLNNTTTCVPRDDGQTMHQLFDGNKATDPDGWTEISWNEIAEGSYIEPLTRYGTQYTDTLKDVIQNNK